MHETSMRSAQGQASTSPVVFFMSILDWCLFGPQGDLFALSLLLRLLSLSFLLQCGLFSSCRGQGLLSSCSVQASHCGGFSCCRVQVLGHTGFSSCGSWAIDCRRNSCGSQA